MQFSRTLVLGASILLAAAVTACGGGGGGSASTPSVAPTSPSGGSGSTGGSGGGGAAPVATPGLSGQAYFATGGTLPNPTYAPATQSGIVVFSCGCTNVAGTATFAAGGGYTIGMSSPAIPTPNPTYTTVPGRNYIVVATQADKSEAWTMEFVGNSPATNQSLANANASTNAAVPDLYTTAASVYVYGQTVNGAGGDTAFDQWNFNTINAWVKSLRAGSQNGAELQLLNDILTAQTNKTTLYPQLLGWSQASSANSTIANDIAAVHTSGDAAIPTPCPSAGCTGTPSP